MKFGWRWFLPVFFILLLLMLVIIHSGPKASDANAGRGSLPIEVDSLPIPADVHALGIFVIPMFLFLPAWLAKNLGGSEAIQLALGIAGVGGIPLVWYFTGRWIDVRLGYLPETPARHPARMRRIAVWMLLVAMVLTCAGLVVGVVAYDIKNEDMWLNGVLWTAFLSMVLIQKIRRWREVPREK